MNSNLMNQQILANIARTVNIKLNKNRNALKYQKKSKKHLIITHMDRFTVTLY